MELNHLACILRLIRYSLQKEFPDFGLSGRLFGPTKESGRWDLVVDSDGVIPVLQPRVTCPHCSGRFLVEGVGRYGRR